MKESDEFLKIVEWSDEDLCDVGSVPGWLGLCCHIKNLFRQIRSQDRPRSAPGFISQGHDRR